MQGEPMRTLPPIGRGPLAGPVTAAAVILDPERVPEGLNDSKQLTARRRVVLAQVLQGCAHVGVGHASVDEIERHNIMRASHIAMQRAIANLPVAPDYVLFDGTMVPRGFNLAGEAVVRGDMRCLSISAASYHG